jgi:transcriptional regulator with XRE-family HTH domain
MNDAKRAKAAARPNIGKSVNAGKSANMAKPPKRVAAVTQKTAETTAKKTAEKTAKKITKSATKKMMKKVVRADASDWLRRMADLEDACDSISVDRRASGSMSAASGGDEASRLRTALGRLIELSRRIRGLTPAQFASAHRISMQELAALERGEGASPNPRTIRAFAKTAGVAASPLLQLAGCAAQVDPDLGREAIRFMSATGRDAKPTREERRRFQAFVKVLSRPA